MSTFSIKPQYQAAFVGFSGANGQLLGDLSQDQLTTLANLAISSGDPSLRGLFVESLPDRIQPVLTINPNNFYKEFIALVTQQGTDDPEILMQSNSFSTPITAARVSEGVYEIRSAGSEFSVSPIKTIILWSNHNSSFNVDPTTVPHEHVIVAGSSTSAISIRTGFNGASEPGYSDSVLFISIMVRVYS